MIAGTLAQRAFAKASGPSPEPAAIERLILPMNRNWRFSRVAVAEARGKDFDDSNFERVVVPHTNIRLPWHSFDDKDYEFVSVYRRHFKLPREVRDRRVFVDFEGVITASTVWLNGVRLGEYKGGYTPFSFELTAHLEFDSDNVLAVEVDSTERNDIPPFGHQIDYLTFGGIYREVALRVVPATFIENISAKPQDVLSPNPSVAVECFLQHSGPSSETLSLEVTLQDGKRVLAAGTRRVEPAEASGDSVAHSVRLERLGPIVLWDLTRPKLYTVRVRLLDGSRPVDEDSRTIGFREARFTEHGFELNGKVIKLRGLDRHQTFPFVGQAM
ncbi:MAG: sugar-binding domain-containing protein, partial [Candidatus Sulfotelmatobacter sp.]